jgi:hypothetical protein
MHTGYDVTLLDGAASGHCTGKLAEGMPVASSSAS